MASFAIGCFKHLVKGNCNRLEPFLQRQSAVVHNVRHNYMFNYLQNEKKHDTEYKYEVSKDPKEWEFVERLMPLETVPVPKAKETYPSGWRPAKEEALQLPYYVERSKNHMLSVYLNCSLRGTKVTVLKRIHGDLWKLHNDIKAYIEEQTGRKIATSVHEGNNQINFKGDRVYYIEQWLLSKGF